MVSKRRDLPYRSAGDRDAGYVRRHGRAGRTGEGGQEAVIIDAELKVAVTTRLFRRRHLPGDEVDAARRATDQ